MIAITDLSFHYANNATPTLHSLSFSLPKHQAHALLGPNGAGKTTLISLIAGILPLQTGRILIDGLDSQKHRRDIQQFMSLVPQEYAFYPRLSGYENLIFFAGLHGLKGSNKHQAINHAIELTGLQNAYKQRAERYSGGLKRRLNLAIALLNKPTLLILDEPTVGIDPQSRHYILDRLQQLQQQGATLIYTSHMLDEVQDLCSHLTMIDHGKIVLNTGMNTALAQQQHTIRIQVHNSQALTQFLIEPHFNPAPTRTLSNSEHTEFIWAIEPSPTGHTTSHSLLLSQCLAQCQQAALPVKTAGLAQARLEDTFLAITHEQLRD